MSCSCPEGGPCARCAATLLEATQRHDGPPPLTLLTPVPAGRARAVAGGGAPRPVLRLRCERIEGKVRRGAERVVGVARLFFDYADRRVAAEGGGFGSGQGKGRWRLRALEGEAQDRLQEFGLVPADQVLGLYLDDADSRRFDAADYVLERGSGRPAAPAHLAKLLPRLAGVYALEFDEGFPVELLQPPQRWQLDVREGDGAWFEVALGIDVAGQRIELLPALRRLLADRTFPRRRAANEADDASWLVALDERRHVPLPLARLRALIEPLTEWLARPLEVGGEAHDDSVLRLRLPQAALLEELPLAWQGGDNLRRRLERLATRREPAQPAPGFAAELRPYQQQGLAWLGFLADAGLGGILADDMGLGKTVQVLAHIWTERARDRLRKPTLVVVPTSLVGNWYREARRFTPQLKLLVLHGAERTRLYRRIATHDLVITTYPLLARDARHLAEHEFGLLVLDEAQTIKNARTQAARAVRSLRAARRLAVTGTPLENHLGELWAQVDAVEPGLLGDERSFTALYRKPIEQQGDVARRQRLNRRIAPLILRRRKEEVAPDLPPRSEILCSVELEGRQRELYEVLRAAQHSRVRAAVAEHGAAQAGIVVIDALLKLRQVCCDPRLVKLKAARSVRESAKLALLLDLLDQLIAAERRVLVFSQFTEMLDLIAAALLQRHIGHLLLTGATRERGALVDRFQNGAAPVFLISLKAGGVGLNLTAADTVIHYDPWWNPAAERQAADRAHRIGQTRPVFVYKLICNGTVEEKIQALQTHKAALAEAVLDGGGSSRAVAFTPEELEELFAPI